MTGVKAYIDVYDTRARLAMEAEGFVVHAENITRSRFDFEKMRVRSLGALGIVYVPFTFDEMDKKPDACRRQLYELFGKFGDWTLADKGSLELSLHEKELLKFSLFVARPIRVRDVQQCLGLTDRAACGKVLRAMVTKKLFRPLFEGRRRNHQFVLTDSAAAGKWK
ncbi:hypothetical protein [Cohnella soli]|uniref:MarR family transcriptional regulator n=1 Tax=Cohnella soli TaxID=425005 RepID=A0ABW0HTC4_9BACL